MNKILIGTLLVSFSFSAFAGGPANKVTGEFTRVSDKNSTTTYECEFTAHEEMGKRFQKGSMYCNRVVPVDNLNAWEILLHNDFACVYVVDDTMARIGGMVTSTEGSASNLAGKYVGFTVYDNGEPAAYEDGFDIHNFYDDADLFWEWCENGGALGNVSPYTLTEGNVKVHYFNK